MKDIIKFNFRGYRISLRGDRNEISYLKKNVKTGDITVDIGAHKGSYLFWLRKCVKKSGKVYAFEPQKKLCTYLEGIIKLKRYKNVFIENLGLSNKSGTRQFFVPSTPAGVSPGASIGATEEGKQYDEISIKTTTLDEYFYDQDIEPDFIKIDVEGHEREVLLGGEKLLRAVRPKILMECENRLLRDETIFDVFQVLSDMKYQGYFFIKNTLKPISEFKIELHQKQGPGRFWAEKGYVNNFVFEPETRANNHKKAQTQ